MLKGSFTSPNYPRNYHGNSICEYLMRTEPTHTLELKFTDFDLEHTTGCRDDYVRIYDGPLMEDGKLLLGSTCGNNASMLNTTFVSRSNEMLLLFRSDVQVESKGFAAEFDTRCGGRINATTSGFIEVGHNLRWSTKSCEWTIVAPKLGKSFLGSDRK